MYPSRPLGIPSRYFLEWKVTRWIPNDCLKSLWTALRMFLVGTTTTIIEENFRFRCQAAKNPAILVFPDPGPA